MTATAGRPLSTNKNGPAGERSQNSECPPSSYSIPPELTKRDQWVLWREELRKGKPSKEPYQPNGKHAKSDAPATWGSYASVTHSLGNGGNWSGIGYVFSADDNLFGIDLDACIDQTTGELTPWAEDVLALCPGTYTEVSPSGEGLKLIAIGNPPLPEGQQERPSRMSLPPLAARRLPKLPFGGSDAISPSRAKCFAAVPRSQNARKVRRLFTMASSTRGGGSKALRQNVNQATSQSMSQATRGLPNVCLPC